jgi:hypothetical protein
LLHPSTRRRRRRRRRRRDSFERRCQLITEIDVHLGYQSDSILSSFHNTCGKEEQALHPVLTVRSAMTPASA